MQSVHHVIHLVFNDTGHIEKEGLVTLMGSTGFELGFSELHVSVLPTTLPTTPPMCWEHLVSVLYRRRVPHYPNSSECFGLSLSSRAS